MKAQRKWVWGEYEETPKYFVFKSGGLQRKIVWRKPVKDINERSRGVQSLRI